MGLFGGEKSTTQSGYGALSKGQRISIMDQVRGLSEFASPFTYNPATGKREVNQANIDRFTPMGETADETRGYDAMRAGFAPTAESLQSDMGMLQNPWDEYVLGDINRQATGDYSILKQGLADAGQFGSNRSILGANDIDLSRLNLIGTFKQGQYNNALNSILNNIIPQRQQDAQNLLGIGAAQRGLDWNTRQAPINALNASTGVLNNLGFNSAVANTSFSTAKSSPGITPLIQAISGGAKTASSLFGGPPVP